MLSNAMGIRGGNPHRSGCPKPSAMRLEFTGTLGTVPLRQRPWAE